MNLAPSFKAARQMINHGHILLNNRKVNICSHECKP
ncbi:MAG: S4 domain-containing protein, partial [Candidatus Hodgkinia cicadicola]